MMSTTQNVFRSYITMRGQHHVITFKGANVRY